MSVNTPPTLVCPDLTSGRLRVGQAMDAGKKVSATRPPSPRSARTAVALGAVTLFLCVAGCNQTSLAPDGGLTAGDALATVDSSPSDSGTVSDGGFSTLPDGCWARVESSLGFHVESGCAVSGGITWENEFFLPHGSAGKFVASLNGFGAAPGVYHYGDFRPNFGTSIVAFLPTGVYGFDVDANWPGVVTLVLRMPSTGIYHGTVDATLPLFHDEPDMGAAGSTCTLHVDF